MATMIAVAANFGPRRGGVESFVDGLARHTWPSTTTVLAPPVPGAQEHDRTLPYAVVRQPLVGRRPWRWRQARQAVRRPADVVLCAEWYPAARALASVPRQGERRVVITHGSEITHAIRHRRSRTAMLRGLRACDTVLAASGFTARVLERLGVEAVVLHPGVALTADHPAPADLTRHLGIAGRRIVLTVARLVPRKGHREMLAHWPHVHRMVPDAVWVVVGDGPLRGELEAAAGPGVVVLGDVDDACRTALYALADLHVMPGTGRYGDVEGFGMAAVEAAAAGTPTVATAVGGVAEAVGRGGVVVPADDHAGLAAAAVDILRSSSLRTELSRAARARAAELAWPLVASRFRAAVTGSP